MVSAQGPKPRCEGGAAAVAQLVGMQLDPQTQSRRGGEEVGDFFGAKGDGFAKGVDGVGKASLRRRRKNLIGNIGEIGVSVVPIFRRHGMCGEQGCADAHRTHRAKLSRDPQHFQLIIAGEPIAGLDFEGCHAIGQKTVEAREGGGGELSFRSSACGRDRRKYAAARPGDLGIGRAL